MIQESGQDKNARQSDRAPFAEILIPFVVMGAVLLIDHQTKRLIETSLQPFQSWVPFPALASVFKITHVTNTGAAFGLFQNGSFFLAVIAFVVSGVIIVFNLGLPARSYLFRVALGFQLGGALGNLIDRIRIGHVTDFLDFGPWPVFNVADLSIVTGVVLLAYLMLLEQRREKRELEKKALAASDAADQDSDSMDDANMLWNE